MNGASWDRLYAQRVDDADGELQRLTPEIPAGVKTGFIRIKITSGWSDICSVFSISMTGTPAAIGNPADGKNSTAAYQGAGSLSSRLSSQGDTYNGSPTHAGGRHKYT